MGEPNAETVAHTARQFVGLVIELLADDKGVHAETAVAGAARLAGTFLFRSFGFELPDAKPGQVVLSEQANDHGPRLVGIVATSLESVGIVAGEPAEISYEGSEPRLSLLATQRLLEPAFNEERERSGISFMQAADAAALATAILIHECREVLDPRKAFGLAVYSIIEGSKTVPAQIES